MTEYEWTEEKKQEFLEVLADIFGWSSPQTTLEDPEVDS